MKIELIEEPHLEFGGDFICDDPKMGISAGGFFSTTNNTHRSELHYALIGTNNNIEEAQKWINRFETFIEATGKDVALKNEATIIDGEIIDLVLDMNNDASLFQELGQDAYQELKKSDILNNDFSDAETIYTINKRLNPDFPGFNSDNPFHCVFTNDNLNNITIKESKIKEIIDNKDLMNFDKVIRLCDLYIDAYKFLIDKSVSKAEVCFIVIPTKIFKQFSSLRFKGGSFFNLSRYLKAQLITLPNAIPVQIILEDTIRSTKRSLQDLSMQAWNFCTANYYKNTGTPWTLTLKDKHTCFIGISFHRVLSSETNVMRSSVAQAFNYEGKGIIFVGEQFEWDSKKMNTPAPHLNYEYAKKLLTQVINEYKIYNKNVPPNRVVIHKTTDFWDSSINQEHAEVEGIKDGIREVLGADVEIDLVTIKSSNIKLLRKEGEYPVLRGTLFHVDDATGILYTTGYIPIMKHFRECIFHIL